MKRNDYLPYGEELSAGMGGRTSAQGYAWDGVRQQFTGYERDAETGLDYARARYYSASCGRFTSPDPLAAFGSVASPQLSRRRLTPPWKARRNRSRRRGCDRS